jgi:hypothetical protein
MPFWVSNKKLDLILANQKTILAALGDLQQGESTTMLDLTALKTAVANEKTVEDSAIQLIQGIAAQLKALISQSGNTVDPATLQTIVDSMTAEQSALAAAVAANTPAAPPVPAPSPVVGAN